MRRNIIKHKTRVLVALTTLFLLGCGGGGGSSAAQDSSIATASTPDTVPSTSNEDVISAAVNISPIISSSARLLIKEISSEDGTHLFSPDVSQQSIKISKVDPLIIATTEKKEIVLASINSDATQELNSDSTALALTRILIDIPYNGTESDLQKKIKTHTKYQSLVKAIDSSLASGKITTQDRDVLINTSLIATDIATDIIDSQNKVTDSSALKAKAMAVVKDVRNPLPYKALELLIGKILITGGLVNVYNSTPLAWTAQTTAYNGQSLGDGSSVLLEGAEFTEWVAAQLPNWLIPAGTQLKNDGDRAFNLIIKQDINSKKKNITDIITTSVSNILAMTLNDNIGTCAKELAESIVNDDINDLILNPNKDNFINYLKASGVNATKTYSTILRGAPRLCPGSEWTSKKTKLLIKLSTFAAKLNFIGQAYSVFDKISTSALLAGKAYWVWDTWDTNQIFRVCVANSNITNCAKRFEFPEELTLLEGASHQPKIIAYDEKGDTTLIPSSVRYSIEGSGVKLEPTNGTLTGKIIAGNAPVTSATLFAEDLATNAKGQALITVESGKLTPSTQTIGLTGESHSVQLLSNSGKPIISTGVNIDWAISDNTIINLFPSTGGTIKLFTANKAGTTNIFANNTISGRILGATVNVGAEQNSVRILSASCGYTSNISCAAKGLCSVLGSNDIAIEITTDIVVTGSVGAIFIDDNSGLSRQGNLNLLSCGTWTEVRNKGVKEGDEYPFTSYCIRESEQPTDTIISAKMRLISVKDGSDSLITSSGFFKMPLSFSIANFSGVNDRTNDRQTISCANESF